MILAILLPPRGKNYRNFFSKIFEGQRTQGYPVTVAHPAESKGAFWGGRRKAPGAPSVFLAIEKINSANSPVIDSKSTSARSASRSSRVESHDRLILIAGVFPASQVQHLNCLPPTR
jgi:hypothetical protein